MVIRKTSFSQSEVFHKCPRTWYYKYIKRVPGIENLMFADGGQCLHKPTDKFYNNKKTPISEIKEYFEMLWHEKYKLDKTDIANRKKIYWDQVLEAINLDLNISHSELKIEFPDVVAYIDGYIEDGLEILDWKSSTRSKENEKDYFDQLMFYCYLIYRKYNIMIKKATVYYLKYKDDRKILSFVPTMDDLRNAAQKHKDTLRKMDYYIKNPDKLPPFNQGYHWSPYKHFWNAREEDTLRYNIIINGGFATLQGPIRKLLNIQLCNKYHYKPKDSYYSEKRNSWKDTTVRVWNEKTQTLPIGLLKGLYKTLFDYGKYIKKNIVIDIEDHRKFNNKILKMPDKFLNDKVLRDYQQGAVTKFVRRETIATLEIGTGGGKSLIMAECIRTLKMPTIVIVPTKKLLVQTAKVLHECLGIEIGQAGMGKRDFKDVTVAIINTLARNPSEYRHELAKFRFAITDESHHAAAMSYYNVSGFLVNTEFRLGCTATNKRDDGNDLLLEGATGPVIERVESYDLIKKGYLVKPTITFIHNYISNKIIKEMESMINPNKKINEEDNYIDFYKAFIMNSEIRNNVIKIIAEKHKGKKILILTKLVDHGIILKNMIEGSEHLHGKTSDKEREKILNDFVEGKLNVLVSTVSIFSEGVDIPQLEIIINASGNRGDTRTIQMLGRVLRTLDGKDNAYYFDFFDNMNMLRNASLARCKALRKQKHTLTFSTIDEFLGVVKKDKNLSLKDFMPVIKQERPNESIVPQDTENSIYVA